MGHIKRKRPKRGAKQFWPRKRAKRERPRIRTWAKIAEVKPLGFAGYKVGMTHVIAVDNRSKSPTKGEEIRLPVTVVECPNLLVAGLRLYSSDAYGASVLIDVMSASLDPTLGRKIKLPKKLKNKISDAESKLEKASDIRLLVYTQPKLTLLGKKKPDIFELAIGGKNLTEKFNFAKEVFGKSLSVADAFSEGQFLDIHAVTTGKGYQGVIKRFGVKLKSHKAEKGRRRIGTLGPWVPKKTSYWIPMAGQMGYHSRTEYNKQLLKIGNISEEKITPAGGFLRYGEVKNNYVLIKGTIAGPKKRLITFTRAIRNHPAEDAKTIVAVSRRSQQ